jgi:peroxiredoxin
MQHYLLNYFLVRYGAQKQRWHDGVFLHLYDRHFNGKAYSWLTPLQARNIGERAARIMATHQGQAAPEITGTDLLGKSVQLSAIQAPYVLLVIWDATCGHCRQALPALNEQYHSRWKAMGLKIVALSKESDGNRDLWKDFVNEQKLTGWTHIYYSKADDKAREEAGLPGYSKLYDVQRVPTFYLLDKDKNIIARKISEQQVEEILKLKAKK